MTNIQEGTLAAQAGLRSGDRIIAVDGQQVTSQQQLEQILRTSSGEVALQVQRDGEEETVYLDVDQAQQQYAQQQQQWQQQQQQWDQQRYQQQAQRPALGVTLGETRDGLIVTSVRQQSPAAQAGLQPGDLLLSVDGQQLQATEQLIRAIAQLQPGDQIEIQAFRQGQQFTTVATLQPWQQAFAGPPVRTQMRFREPRMAMRPDFDRPQQGMQGAVQSLQQEVQQLRQQVQQLQQQVQQLDGAQPDQPGQPQPPQPQE